MWIKLCARCGIREREKKRRRRVDKRAKKGYNKAMTDTSKTIVAIATPRGEGAIGIVRISGPDAIGATAAVFTPRKKGKLEQAKLYRGKLSAGGYEDDCMAAVFYAPNSYTGEDSAELYLHGGVALLDGVVEALIAEQGLTGAEGGDFTARAVMNGKLDLTGAEGVLDIINARSRAEVRGAYKLLSGELKAGIESIQHRIVEVMAASEAALDYPEEDVAEQTTDALEAGLKEIAARLDALIGTYRAGRMSEHGVKVALIGPPNSGKSSLLNALVGYSRAIVTDEAGTTRDPIDAAYIYKGVRFSVTDTAGLREAESLPERMGIERAREAAADADVVLLVTEAGKAEVAAAALDKNVGAGAVIVVENKVDIFEPKDASSARTTLVGKVKGVDELKERIYRECGVESGESGAVLVNERQLTAAVAARESVSRAIKNVGLVPTELINADLGEAFAALGTVTGVSGSDALLSELFSRFCVGK